MMGKIDLRLKSFFDELISENTGFLKEVYIRIKDFTSGGKRVRGLLLVQTYNNFGGKEDITDIALALELLHASTLVHDDIMDGDEFRRGMPSMFVKFAEECDNEGKSSIFKSKSLSYGVSQAICVGNILYNLGLKLILDSKVECKIRLLDTLVKTYMTVNEGQMLDLEFENREITETECFDMIGKKTATLFTACVEMALILVGKEDNELVQAGFNKGVAFQLKNDLKDIEQDRSANKKTLVLIKEKELGLEKAVEYVEELIGKYT